MGWIKQIGDLAEACGVVVATSLFQHLDVLMRKVGSTPGDAATWRRAVGLLRALQVRRLRPPTRASPQKVGRRAVSAFAPPLWNKRGASYPELCLLLDCVLGQTRRTLVLG